MKTITVTRTIPAPIEKVFDLLADHGNYKQNFGVKDSKLLREGKPDRNGLGAVRWIDAGPIQFEEEITHYDRPRRYDYLITRCSAPLEHQGGSIRFESAGNATQVTWTSVMRVKVPVIGGLLTRILAGKLGQAFGAMLKATERRLAA
ncbi:MAG: SRPBCC family protein [Gammaproteobacteria bacterium]